MRYERKNIGNKECYEKELNCKKGDCGDHFAFTIDEQNMNTMPEHLMQFDGICKRCGVKITFNAQQLEDFTKLFGNAEVQIVNSTFDKLFD